MASYEIDYPYRHAQYINFDVSRKAIHVENALYLPPTPNFTRVIISPWDGMYGPPGSEQELLILFQVVENSGLPHVIFMSDKLCRSILEGTYDKRDNHTKLEQHLLDMARQWNNIFQFPSSLLTKPLFVMACIYAHFLDTISVPYIVEYARLYPGLPYNVDPHPKFMSEPMLLYLALRYFEPYVAKHGRDRARFQNGIPNIGYPYPARAAAPNVDFPTYDTYARPQELMINNVDPYGFYLHGLTYLQSNDVMTNVSVASIMHFSEPDAYKRTYPMTPLLLFMVLYWDEIFSPPKNYPPMNSSLKKASSNLDIQSGVDLVPPKEEYLFYRTLDAIQWAMTTITQNAATLAPNYLKLLFNLIEDSKNLPRDPKREPTTESEQGDAKGEKDAAEDVDITADEILEMLATPEQQKQMDDDAKSEADDAKIENMEEHFQNAEALAEETDLVLTQSTNVLDGTDTVAIAAHLADDAMTSNLQTKEERHLAVIEIQTKKMFTLFLRIEYELRFLYNLLRRVGSSSQVLVDKVNKALGKLHVAKENLTKAISETKKETAKLIATEAVAPDRVTEIAPMAAALVMNRRTPQLYYHKYTKQKQAQPVRLQLGPPRDLPTSTNRKTIEAVPSPWWQAALLGTIGVGAGSAVLGYLIKKIFGWFRKTPYKAPPTRKNIPSQKKLAHVEKRTPTGKKR